MFRGCCANRSGRHGSSVSPCSTGIITTTATMRARAGGSRDASLAGDIEDTPRTHLCQRYL